MAAKIRVAVWGTGLIGAACIKQILRQPELELVGALVYSEAKQGRDIGAIVGVVDCGVLATNDRSAFYATKPDCIVHTARDFGEFASDADIIEMLDRGFDVVTSLPYHWLKVRPAQVVAAIRDASKRGSATLTATGINPNMMVERMALSATALSSDIQLIQMEEFIRIGSEAEDTLKNFGFGVSVEQARSGPVRKIAEQYFGQSLYYVADAIGAPVDELHYSGEFRVAHTPVLTPSMTINPGEVEFISHRWEARPKNGPVVASQFRWYVDDSQRPEGVPCEDYYQITIEGRPSVRLKCELRASLKDYLRFSPGDPTAPVYYAIANTLIQAIPHVIAAAPGIRPTALPSNSYWKTDLRLPLL